MAGAPADPLAGTQPAQSASGQWGNVVPPLVDTACGIVLPQWDIKAEERAAISESLTECIEQLFPGGIDGKYGCWVRLIFTGCAITVSRVQQHGRLPPLFFPVKRPAQPGEMPARDPHTLTSLTE